MVVVVYKKRIGSTGEYDFTEQRNKMKSRISWNSLNIAIGYVCFVAAFSRWAIFLISCIEILRLRGALKYSYVFFVLYSAVVVCTDVQYVGGGSCLAKVQWCEERDRLEAGLKRTSVGPSVVTRSVCRDGFRAERSGGMRRLCVHQPAGGRQNSHATSGRAKEPRILPCVLSQRLPRFLYYRQSGRTSGITERISTRAMLSVFYEWSQARVVRHHRVLGLHPHQWKGQRCQNHSSRGYGWSGGSCDGQPHILGQ